MKREQVKNLLQNNICEVVFTKADGTERVLTGTLIPDLYPEVVGGSPSKENLEIVKVFDLDKNEWRSFRMDRFISIRVVA